MIFEALARHLSLLTVFCDSSFYYPSLHSGHLRTRAHLRCSL